jgi:hypothetical protein
MWNRNVIDPAMPAMIRRPSIAYLRTRFPREQATAIWRMWEWLTPHDLTTLGFGPRPDRPRRRGEPMQ